MNIRNNSRIKVKTGYCKKCGNGIEKPLIAGLCQRHYWDSRENKQNSEVQLKRKPIRKISKKRSSEMAVYLKKKIEFLNDNADCSVCGCPATDIHHMKGRQNNMLMDERYFLSVCRSCHNKIEQNPLWAKENNYSLSRL